MKFSDYRKDFYKRAGNRVDALLEDEHIRWVINTIIDDGIYQAPEAKEFIDKVKAKQHLTHNEKILVRYIYTERLKEN